MALLTNEPETVVDSKLRGNLAKTQVQKEGSEGEVEFMIGTV